MRQGRRITTGAAPSGQSRRSEVDPAGSSSYPCRDTRPLKSRLSLAHCVNLLGLVGLVTLSALTPACAPELDVSRAPPRRGSVGEEMFGVICDRVGAQALREDLTGESFRGICHKPTVDGEFADKVDETKLPSLDPAGARENGDYVPVEEQRKSRDFAIGRVEALGRRRADLIRALDATFPEKTIPIKDIDNADESRSCEAPEKNGEGLLTDQIADMLGRMGDLYNDGTLPQSTESLARVMDAFQKDEAAQAAWARLSARQGYRPIETGLGAARPLIAYPRLRDLSNASLRLLSADSNPYELDPKRDEDGNRIAVPGPGNAALNKMLEAGHEELLATKADPVAPALTVTKDPTGRVILSRPRDNIEMFKEILFASDPAFGGGASKFIVKRDSRGYAAIAGGAVPAPFLDANKDGLPDVDESGRFKTSDNSLAPSPFPFPGAAGSKNAARDSSGRALAGSQLLYDYIDTSHTFAAQMMADLKPLVNPNPDAKHETLMDMLGGMHVAVGPRGPRSKAYAGGKNVDYQGIGADSPMLDLIYAMSVILSDRTTDTTLTLAHDLFTAKPKEMARVTGAMSKAFDIAQKHAEAKIPRTATFWDETLDTVGKIAREPLLLEDVLKALAVPETAQLGPIFSRYANLRDDISYDKADINGTTWNLTTNTKGEMTTPVDRTKPETGKNRSGLYRFLQLISDTTGVTACNKQGAKVHALGISLPGSFDECAVFRIENLSAFYLDSIANAAQYDDGASRPKRGSIYMRPLILRIAPGVVNILQSSSGIDGMYPAGGGVFGEIVAPTPKFLNRLVFFDQKNDTQNPKTLLFVSDLQGEFIGTSVCPERVINDPVPDAFDKTPDGKIHGLRNCPDGQWLQQRSANTLFTWENFGFYTAIAPVLGAFVKHGREDLFLELSNAVFKHWPGEAASADECRLAGNKTCPKSGMNSYSALIAEAFAGDVLPAVVELAKALENLPIQRCDEVDATTKACTKVVTITGIDAASAATRAMVDSEYSKSTLQLKDRKGGASAKRNDGTTNAQVTPAYLLTNALGAIDTAFDTYEQQNPQDKDRRTNWRRARSQLVDQFMGVTGAPSSSTFSGPTMTKMTPVILDIVRSQLNAHCPQSFTPPYAKCTWARDELTKKAEATLTGPLASTALDMMESLRADKDGRVQMELLMQYLLDSASKNDALASMLASSNDLVQLLRDDQNIVPLFHVLASAMDASKTDDRGHVTQKSLVDAQMALLAKVSGRYFDKDSNEICKREIDPNQVLAIALGNLVTPINNADFKGQTPLEVVIDVIADVNRVDPTQKYEGTLNRSDYASVSANVVDFLVNKERGLEQFYEVIRQGTQ